MPTMRRTARIVALVVLFALAFAAAWIRLPYYAVGPGPANDVATLIHVQDVPRYGSEGTFIMTNVLWQQVTALQSLVAWIDESRFIVGEDVIYPPGVDREQEQERAISQMDQSKIDASIVVLTELFDYPEEHGNGALGHRVLDEVVPVRVGPGEGDEEPAGAQEAGVELDRRRDQVRRLPAHEQATDRVRDLGEGHRDHAPASP